MRALIIGYGRVGQALSKQIVAEVGTFHPFDRYTEVEHLDLLIKEHDVIFICLKSVGDGSESLRYIKKALFLGKKVVICEKSALAHHFGELKHHLDRIGYLAVVGGGSGILHLLKPTPIGVKRIVGIVNGSLNLLFSEFARDKSVDTALMTAKKLNLLEEDADNLVDMFNGELNDIVLKLVSVFNISGVSEQILNRGSFEFEPLSKNGIIRLIESGQRPMISIDKCRWGCRQTLVEYKIDGWNVGVYFSKEEGFLHPFPDGINNSLMVEGYCGREMIYGIGAGPIQTASIMLCEAKLMLGQTK